MKNPVKAQTLTDWDGNISVENGLTTYLDGQALILRAKDGQPDGRWVMSRGAPPDYKRWYVEWPGGEGYDQPGLGEDLPLHMGDLMVLDEYYDWYSEKDWPTLYSAYRSTASMEGRPPPIVGMIDSPVRLSGFRIARTS